ncbi:SpoIIE family protein phosphatase [Pseudidiomarina sp. 1APR75-15]|uniref:SpoIIE family protein phosphatase n=1 Tax=Pseudidiomarina terrestris TaxID=2820060 RepID=A0ABT8MKA9_9GAMM|nr:SpoIIE family protein phosphatase [Pseudidiomarina sp. 1APR75-15]MDN7130392.1 SpoIIE family protein phosphatase [Pseudidiomarina sp. 1APR75-15]
MLKPSQQIVIDIFQDGSEFAISVVEKLQRLRVARRVRVKNLSDWRSDLNHVHPTLVVTSELVPQLLSPLRCPQQLLILPRASDLESSLRWHGDVLSWPEKTGVILQRIDLMANSFNTARQLNAVRESLIWHTQRVEREHELIERIFRNALSRNFTHYEHIRTLLTPASKFNGDLCLITPGPLGNLYILMADFTGHGLAPATGALPLSQAFFAMADRGVSVSEMVVEFNYRLHRLLPSDMFCACFLMELSASGKRLTYWNGGMPPALVFGPDGMVKHRLRAQHMALGVLSVEDFDSQVATISTRTDDTIAMYTDGVIEMLSQRDEFLGMDAFEEIIQTYPGLSNFDRLVAELENFRGSQPLQDDVSLAILECCPTGLEPPEIGPELQALPFVFSTVLDAEDLQQIDVVASILGILGRLPALHAHRTTIYLLLAEVFNNALEHGLLGLDSRMKNDPEGFAYYYQLRADRLQALTSGSISIEVCFEQRRNYLKFTVRNTGLPWARAELASLDKTSLPYGRGLDLLQQLACDLNWSDEGREVSFGYYLTSS